MNKKISFLLIFFLLTAVSVFSQEDNASVESEEVAEERTDVIVETVELSETEEASADTEETSAEAAPEEEIVETPESEVTETAEQTAETSEIEEASADAEETSAEVASEEEPVETPESETSEVTEAESVSLSAVVPGRNSSIEYPHGKFLSSRLNTKSCA